MDEFFAGFRWRTSTRPAIYLECARIGCLQQHAPADGLWYQLEFVLHARYDEMALRGSGKTASDAPVGQSCT